MTMTIEQMISEVQELCESIHESQAEIYSWTEQIQHNLIMGIK